MYSLSIIRQFKKCVVCFFYKDSPLHLESCVLGAWNLKIPHNYKSIKMNASFRIVVCSFLLISFVYECAGINCYYCNSANNSACVDLDLMDDSLRARIIPVVNCEAAIPSPVAVNFFCRKIVQTIFHSRHDSELRVTRGCGWVRHHKDCYRADNSDHLETVCQCFTDHCNSAELVDPTTNTVLFLCLAAVLYFVR